MTASLHSAEAVGTELSTRLAACTTALGAETDLAHEIAASDFQDAIDAALDDDIGDDMARLCDLARGAQERCGDRSETREGHLEQGFQRAGFQRCPHHLGDSDAIAVQDGQRLCAAAAVGR